MKPSFRRDVPIGAALTVAALALVASVVAGRDEARAPAIVAEPAAAPPPPVVREDRPVLTDDLDLDRLNRPKKETAPQDLFASRSWLPAPAAAAANIAAQKPAPPPAPSAPPLPFRYLGQMEDNDRLTVFLERGPEALSASVGDVLDGMYRIDRISESDVQFVYLPLGTKQVLSVPAAK